MVISSDKSVLRLTTSGSVDNGKSTLLGRILYECGAVFDDHFEQLVQISKRTKKPIDYSLLLDGLSAEREQGITIDVAHRYFETKNKKYILTDTPGHVQYTRNMVTGASLAQVAMVLVDATLGINEQTKRHLFILSLLRVSQVILVINKMDLVAYSESVYTQIKSDVFSFASQLDGVAMVAIPVSALQGDNVMKPSLNMPWYGGSTVLDYLEQYHSNLSHNSVDFRFPIQMVMRPNQSFRGYAGQVVSGRIRTGDDVVVLPSGLTSKVKEIWDFKTPKEASKEGDCVTLTLTNDLDISRGDMIVRLQNVPNIATKIEAMIVWMDQTAMDQRKKYQLKHTTQMVDAYIDQLFYTVDIDTLHRIHHAGVSLNDIARVSISLTRPIYYDFFSTNKATGSFILIDPDTQKTVAAGMIKPATLDTKQIAKKQHADIKKETSSNVFWESFDVDLALREQQNKHLATVLWFTGFSGAGKSTISKALERVLFDKKYQVANLDGDNIRHGLNGDLGFSQTDRQENIRRIGEVAKLFHDQGNIVLCSFISPYKKDREFVRHLMPQGRFVEVFVDCSIETCQTRDPKGLYKKVSAGEIPHFTGISSPYEVPIQPEIHINTDILTIEESVQKIMMYLKETQVI